MPNLKEVKTRINSVISTQQITKAMKMVAAAKLRKAQDRIIQMRPYAKKLSQMLQNVSTGYLDADNISYTQERGISKVLLIVVTSDRGLCGAFNSNVIKKVNSLIQSKYKTQLDRNDLTILPIGKRALDFYLRRNFNIISDFALTFHALNFSSVRKIAEFVMKKFSEGEFDHVEIIYNEFKNVATQILRTEQYLPIEKAEDDKTSFQVDYIYEPNQEFIIKELIPKSLKMQLFKALAESYAAENGARMTAMHKATENAGELIDELRLTYNRTRQAAITKEINEIVGGAEALKG